MDTKEPLNYSASISKYKKHMNIRWKMRGKIYIQRQMQIEEGSGNRLHEIWLTKKDCKFMINGYAYEKIVCAEGKLRGRGRYIIKILRVLISKKDKRKKKHHKWLLKYRYKHPVSNQ